MDQHPLILSSITSPIQLSSSSIPTPAVLASHAHLYSRKSVIFVLFFNLAYPQALAITGFLEETT